MPMKKGAAGELPIIGKYDFTHQDGYHHHVLIWCRLYDVLARSCRNFWDIA